MFNYLLQQKKHIKIWGKYKKDSQKPKKKEDKIIKNPEIPLLNLGKKRKKKDEENLSTFKISNSNLKHKMFTLNEQILKNKNYLLKEE